MNPPIGGERGGKAQAQVHFAELEVAESRLALLSPSFSHTITIASTLQQLSLCRPSSDGEGLNLLGVRLTSIQCQRCYYLHAG